MDIARYAIRRPVNMWMLALACLAGGLFAFFQLERLEDPEFTIKEAIIVTAYPGASAEEVEAEVTDLLESAIQQMPQLKEIRSKSIAGNSEVRVEIREEYSSEEIPQIWDELRRRIRDAEGDLPPGAATPAVNDDFGDVFGIFYAITGDGLTLTEMNEAAKALRRGLLGAEGVGKVDISGVIEEHIIVEVDQARLAALNLSPQELTAAVAGAGQVVDGGGLRAGDLFLRVSPTGAYDTLDAVRALPLGAGERRLLLGDVASVRREYAEQPRQLIRYDGRPALTLGIAALPSENIVKVGKAVQAELDRLLLQAPAGFELHPLYDQPAEVQSAINEFGLNVILSLAIVVGVLCLAMGWRAGVIIGVILVLTVAGTLFGMYVLNLQLERVSLAALVIAMGMMLDNAVVVCDGMQVNLRNGSSRVRAASKAVRLTQWPLLGATVIGILAFAGIGLSQDTTGEFLYSLFMVIAISLTLSWILAVTLVPVMGYHWLPRPRRRKTTEGGQDRDRSPYEGPVYRRFRQLVERSTRHRWLVIVLATGLTVASVYAFRFVPQSFFPASSTPMFFIDVRAQQGTDARATDRHMQEIEAYLQEEYDEIEHFATFVGAGASRFVLTYSPEQPDPAYGHVIALLDEDADIEAIVARFNREAPQRFTGVQAHAERLIFGGGSEAKIEARFSGPDAATLRALSERARELIQRQTGLENVRDDWRDREMVLRPRLDLDRMAEAGVTREAVGQAMLTATEGASVGVFREGDEQRPILVRASRDDRPEPQELSQRLVWSQGAGAYVPLSQVIDGIEPELQESVIHRMNRQRMLTVRAEPPVGVYTTDAQAQVEELLAQMPLPPSYELTWGGERESSGDAQTALLSTIVVPYLGMLVLTVLMFARVRQPLVIWLTVPMSICGVTIGLLLAREAFGFVSLLGLLSLTGLLLKNAIVLVSEIDRLICEQRLARFTGIVEATVSRLTPVSMTSATTVLGMVPLIFDPLFSSMAVTIMGGLGFATVLTLFVVPSLYAAVFRVKPDETGDSA